MDLNEKLAQRRKEREQEAVSYQATHELEQKTPVMDKGPAVPIQSAPIDDRIKQALNADHEKKMLLQRMAISKVEPWKWVVTVAGLLGSLVAMGGSFLVGAFFFGAFVWFAKISLEKAALDVERERSALAEAKRLLNDH